MTIKWDKRFSVDHLAIDAEHKLLLTTINAIEIALRHPEDKEPILFFIDQLCDFGLEHFKHEEKLQIKHQYPFIDDNVKGHENLTTDLKRIRDDIYETMKNDTLSAEDITKMYGYVTYLAKDWLITHVLKEDLRMKGFMGEGYE
jgi:hemerythrin